MAGTTIKVRIVEEISPPMMAMPMAILGFEDSLRPMAIGIVPAIRAKDVIKIGRKRVLPAKISASLRDFPCSIK